MLQVQKLGEAILKSSVGEQRLAENDINDLRLAALFHDIGHGPFSHTSEEVYGTDPVFEALKPEGTNPNPHELLSYHIITSKSFKAYCRKVEKNHPVNVPEEEIAKYIIGSCAEPPKPFKRELINGPFDADKLDYLFRDSHFSGLPLSVDLDRLFYTVRIGEAKDERRLVVVQSGATSLEQILFSKMVLFTTVYQHHKVRASDCMFAGIIEYMKEKGLVMKMRDRKINWQSPVDFLWVTDSEFLSHGFETKDDNLHKLIHNLFFRRLLKRALIISKRTIELKDTDK